MFKSVVFFNWISPNPKLTQLSSQKYPIFVFPLHSNDLINNPFKQIKRTRVQNEPETELLSVIWTEGLATLRVFLSTVGQKCLKKQFVENFKKNIGTLGCEEIHF